MSRVRSFTLVGLTAVFLAAIACEDAKRPPVDNGGSGGAGAAGSGGSAGGPAGTAGTGGAAGQSGGGSAGAGGSTTPPRRDGGSGARVDGGGAGGGVTACPPNANGMPCSAGGGTPAVCMNPGGGALSGCICVQMAWRCASLPGAGGGGGGGGGTRPDGGIGIPPGLPPVAACPANPMTEVCPMPGALCTQNADGGIGGLCACMRDQQGVLHWRCSLGGA